MLTREVRPNLSPETNLSGANGTGKISVPCSADYEQHWQQNSVVDLPIFYYNYA
jgi:hypothetical protein